MKITPALIGAAAALALAGCSKPAQENDAGNATVSDNGAAVAPDNGEATNAATPQPAASVAAAPAPTPTATPKKADEPETAATLPVPFGKYAVNQSCADAAAGNDYLGLSRGNWSEIDGDTPIGPFRNVGGNRWALGHGSGLTITVTGPKSFTENGRKMTWCKA